MPEVRLPARRCGPGFVDAVASRVAELQRVAGPGVTEVWVTSTPAFVDSVLAELGRPPAPRTGPSSSFVVGGVSVVLSPLQSWSEWWDERTFFVEGGSGSTWVEGTGDVDLPGLSPAQLEVYAVLRHVDEWSPAAAASAAAGIAPSVS